MSFYLYMLRCEDGSIYTGTAKDYLKRYEEHLNGKGAKYTRSHRVKKIERVFLCENRSIACILESEIKKLTKNKNLKEKLEYKKMLRYPVNMKLLLINLIMSI